MRKYIVFLLALSVVLSLVGCAGSSSNSNAKQLSVYSFKGENEQIEISNGVIILDVASCSMTFYTIKMENKEQYFQMP